MSAPHDGGSPACWKGEIPSLERLLTIASGFSERCYICRWILLNQGFRTDLLNPLPIGGVIITPEAQHVHLLSHGDDRDAGR
jgi:hypothetical protein